MATIIENLSKWVTSVKFEDIPSKVKKKAKLQILNNLAAVFSSIRSKECRAIISTTRLNSGEGKSSAFLLNSYRRVECKKVSSLWAILNNASCSMTFDFDDYLFLGHTGHSSVFVPLAIGEEKQVSGKEVLLSQIISNEIEGRLGASSVLGPQNGQTLSFIHLAGSSAASSRLLGLNEKECANAMAISLYLPPFTMIAGFMSPTSKLLTASFPSAIGHLSAMYAKQGLTGPTDVIENKKGLLERFTYKPIEKMFTGLGKKWTTNTIAYKIYPGCAYIDAPVDCIMKIMKQFKDENGRDIKVDDISNIIVESTILSAGMQSLSSPFFSKDNISPVNINFSIPLSLSLAILEYGNLTTSSFAEENLSHKKKDLIRLAERIIVKHNWQLTLDMVKRMNEKVNFFVLLKNFSLYDLIKIRNGIKKEIGFSPKLLNYLSLLRGKHLKSIMELIYNYSYNRDDDLSSTDLDNFPMPFSAEITLKTCNGKEYYASSIDPLGTPQRPMEETEELVRKKFIECSDTVMERDASQKIMDGVMDIENITDIRNLLAL